MSETDAETTAAFLLERVRAGRCRVSNDCAKLPPP